MIFQESFVDRGGLFTVLVSFTVLVLHARSLLTLLASNTVRLTKAIAKLKFA